VTATQTIIHGDCIDVMKRLDDRSADMVFADPPYNQGVDYGQGAAFDKMGATEFEEFVADWIGESVRLLPRSPRTGSLWVLVSEGLADEHGIELREWIPRRNRIIWHERFGQYQEVNFTGEHRHLFYHAYPDCTWNPDAIRVQSVRQKMNDKRAKGPRVPGNVWDSPRVQGNNGTRVPWHPTQLHAPSLERIVLCSTNPGDTVLEPFSGSAILGVICKKLGRNYIGIDSNPEYVKLGQERIDAA